MAKRAAARDEDVCKPVVKWERKWSLQLSMLIARAAAQSIDDSVQVDRAAPSTDREPPRFSAGARRRNSLNSLSNSAHCFASGGIGHAQSVPVA
eukprot:9760668-Lingulodinium_polyedra.AAC.1